jgi:diguanylate cyclase (GGDEF)-like protein
MISPRSDLGDTPGYRSASRRWGLWSIPMSARIFLLLVETCAIAVTTALLLTEPASPSTLRRFVVLAALSIGYSELAARSERMKRYLGSDKLFANPMSVWSFAAVLTVPAGWAAALIAVQYGHALQQRRRDKSGHPYRVVFTAAAAMLAQLAAAVTIDSGASSGVLHGQVLASLAVLGGVGVFTAVNFAILLAGMWLTARPPSIRPMLPDHDALGYELATLLLGIAAAEFLLHTAVLVPVMLVLVAYLHRSSVVKSLQHAARTDTKTGLLNAAAWTEHANGVLSRSARAGRAVAVLVIDIDWFKRINDTKGHLVGDQVLIAVAACLRRELRGHDGLGRFGGDEFVAVLDELDLARAESIGNRLRAAVSSLQVVEGMPISVSIGLAHALPHDQPDNVAQLLDRADAALYVAKSLGRDRLSTCDRGRA